MLNDSFGILGFLGRRRPAQWIVGLFVAIILIEPFALTGVAIASTRQTALAGTSTSSAPAPELPTEIGRTVPLAENTEVVRESDGTYTAKVHSDRIYYTDETGAMGRIKSDLVDSAPGYLKNKANDISVELSKNPRSGATDDIKVGMYGFEVSMGLPEAVTADSPRGDEISYRGGRARYDYEIRPSGLKETIVLNSPPASSSFRFPVDLGGLTPLTESDGSWALKSPDGEPVFRLARPFMKDSSGGEESAGYNYNVSYLVETVGGQSYLTVSADAGFLNDPDTVYPVAIDPTVESYYSPNRDVSWWDYSETNPIDRTTATLREGVSASVPTTTHRAFIGFDVSEVLRLANTINSADLRVVSVNGATSDVQLMEVSPDAFQWSEKKGGDYAWSDQPAYVGEKGSDTQSVATGDVTFDATTIVADWMVRGKENGFVLMAPNEGIGDTYHEFASREATEADRPVLTVNFATPEFLGAESYWSFENEDLGNGYNAQINVANGNLAVSKTDLSVSDRAFSLTFARTYNSKSASEDALVPMGPGWRANLPTVSEDVSAGRVKYIDDDGTTHYFTKKTDGTYLSPPGVDQLVLAKNGSTFSITFPDYTTQTYDAQGRITKVSDKYQSSTGDAVNVLAYIYDGNGHLSEIRSPSNPTGRKLSLTYTSGKLTKVEEVGISGRHVTFDYTNGKLYKATNPAAISPYKETLFEYDASGLLNRVQPPGVSYDAWTFTHSGGKASSWRDPRYEGTSTESSLSYTTTATADLTTATDPAGRTTKYYVGKHGLVAEILDYKGGKTLYSYDGDFNQTKEEDRDVTNDVVANSETTYNASGDVATETDQIETSDFATSSYEYNDPDAPHDPSESTTPLDNTTTSDYTSEGDLGHQIDPQEVNETNTYDQYGNTIKTKSWARIIDSFALNHSFEKFDPTGAVSAEAWSNYSTGGYERIYFGSGSIKGNAAAKITGNGTQTGRGVWTYLWGLPQEKSSTYTISGSINIPSYTGGTFHSMRARVYYTDAPWTTSSSDVFDGPIFTGATNGWHPISKTFTTSSTRDVHHINFYAWADTGDAWNGTAYMDGMQFEKAPLLADFNMTSNGGFDRDEEDSGLGDGIPDGWTPEERGTGEFSSSATAFTGVKSAKLAAGSSAGNTVVLAAGYSVNRLTDNQSTVETDTTGFVAVNIPSQNMTKSSARSWHMSNSLRAATNGSASDQGFATSTSSGVAASQTHTASAYVTGSGTVKLILVERNSSDAWLGQTASANVALDGTWKRITVSRAFGASGVKARLAVLTSSPQSVVFYSDAMQIEQNTSTASNWVRTSLQNQIVPLKPNTEYTLTATAKTEGAGLGASDVDILSLTPDRGNTVSLQAKGTFGWKTLSTQFTTGSNVLRVARLEAKATPANATVYFDGIKLEEVRRESTSTFDPASNYRNKATDTDTLGKTTSYEYDSRGNVTKTIYHDGTSTAQSYNTRDLVTSEMDILGNIKRFDYDDRGNRITSVSARGFTTSYSYIDGTGVLDSVIDPLSRTTSMAYDSLGNRTLITKPSGATIGTSYDTLNRVTTVSYSGSPVYGHGYDSLSQKTVVFDGSGATLDSFGYDMASQMTADTDYNIPTSAYTATFGYDKEGKQTTAVYSGATTTYGYDSGGKVTSMARTGQPSIILDFNEKGAPVRTSRAGVLDSFTAYDLRGQVTDLNHVKANGSILQENRYIYDSDGNITSHSVSGAGTTSYSYDNGDRLETWTNPANGKIYEYNYNADDDLTSVTTDVDGQSVILQSFGHDAANQVTTYSDIRSGTTEDYTFAYDTDGNLTSDGVAAYTWDDGGRLTGYQNPDSGTTVDYTYSSDGLRTSKTINGARTVYHWIGTQMVAERNASGATIATYAYLPGDFAPVSMTRDGAAYVYVKNARGDVTHITSSTGDVVAKYTYDPWGNPLTITDGAGSDVSSDASHIANKNPWRYAGYYWDQGSGMYYLQARYYRPDLYRFISVDPEPDENAYNYAKDNPVVGTDPDGNLVAIGVIFAGLGLYFSGLSIHYYHVTTPKKKRRWHGYLWAAFGLGGGKGQVGRGVARAATHGANGLKRTAPAHNKAIKKTIMNLSVKSKSVPIGQAKLDQLRRVVSKAGGKVTPVKSGEQGSGKNPHVHVTGFGKKRSSRHIYVEPTVK